MSGARPLVGSSTSRSRLVFSSARASDTICCWPPDRVPAACPARAVRSGKSSCTSIRPGAPPRSASRRFSATVSFEKTSRSSGTYPTPRCTMRWVDSESMRTPSSSTRPLRSISPRMALIVDVLPTPFRPSRAVTPVAGTSKLTLSTTCWPAILARRPSTRRMGEASRRMGTASRRMGAVIRSPPGRRFGPRDRPSRPRVCRRRAAARGA